MKKHLFIISILLFFLLPVSIAGAAGFSSNPDAVEKAAKSVLMLEVMKDGEVIATGSGFVAFDNKTLVTNYHVIDDSDMIFAVSDDGYEYIIMDVCIADEEKDLAILRFFSPTDLQPLPLHTAVDQKRIESVVAIGSPKGYKNTISIGNISSIFEENGLQLLQFTAPISHGSSGGALFDDDGEIIGVTSMTQIDSQNINFAIHAKEVQALYDRWDGKLTDLDDFNAPTPTPVPTPMPTPIPTSTPAPTTKPTEIAQSFNKSTSANPWILDLSSNATATSISIELIAFNCTSLHIYYKKSNSNDWIYWNTPYSKNKSLISLTPNTNYNIKVIAVGENGKQSDPYIFSRRTLSNPSTTTASSIPSSLLQVAYKYGMTDPAIQTIKKKMQSYGYYTKGADVSSKYNDIMVERIEHFQRNNGLKVTGQIDYAFLSKLYSGNVVKTNNYD